MAQDAELLQDDSLPARQRVACRLLVCEKRILHDALDDLMTVECAPTTSDLTGFDTDALEQASSKVWLM
jgi:hypothetical protein